MKKAILISIIFLLLIVVLVNAAPPVTQEFVGTKGIEIVFPKRQIIQQYQTVKLHTHIFNASDGLYMTNESARCFVHLYDGDGGHQLVGEMRGDSNLVEFAYTINGENFSEVGIFAYVIFCNSSVVGGFVSGSYEVTASGDPEVYNDSVISIGVILFLLILTLPLFIVGWKQDSIIKHKFADFVVKKCLLILGVYMLIFDTTVLITMASNANLGVNEELFFIMWLIQMLLYPMLVYLVWTMFNGGIKMFKQEKENKRMGY